MKAKKFAKPFLFIHMGPRSNLLSKNIEENLMTLSLGHRGRNEAMAGIVNSKNMVLGNKVAAVPGLWIKYLQYNHRTHNSLGFSRGGSIVCFEMLIIRNSITDF